MSSALKNPNAGGDHFVELLVGDRALVLYDPQPHEQREANIGGGSFALAVENVEEAVEELKAKGVKIDLGPFESPVCWAALFKDSEGNGLALHARKDGTCG